MNAHDFLNLDNLRITEYLIAALYIALFIPLWGFLNRPALVRIAKSVEKPILDWFTVPEGFYLHPGHAWAKSEKDAVKVGLDDFAHNLVGPITRIELPEPGKKVKQGETAFRIWVDEKPFDVLSPVDGKVTGINQRIIEKPGETGADPYGSSWFFTVSPEKLSTNLHSLLSGTAARAFLERALNQLIVAPAPSRARTVRVSFDEPSWQEDGMVRQAAVASSSRGRISMPRHGIPAYAQDGGVPVAGFAKELAPECWDEVVRKQFLTMN